MRRVAQSVPVEPGQLTSETSGSRDEEKAEGTPEATVQEAVDGIWKSTVVVPRRARACYLRKAGSGGLLPLAPQHKMPPFPTAHVWLSPVAMAVTPLVSPATEMGTRLER